MVNDIEINLKLRFLLPKVCTVLQKLLLDNQICYNEFYLLKKVHILTTYSQFKINDLFLSIVLSTTKPFSVSLLGSKVW